MKLHTIVAQYIVYRKSLGEQFIAPERRLKAFVRNIGQDKNLSDVQAKQVDLFLAGEGPFTINWHKKHQALQGFYRYVISRGYIKGAPLPVVIPKMPPLFIPYIYSIQELQILLDTSMTYQKRTSLLEPYMVRTFLLLLYGAGLRLREAINLTLADVDLPQSILTIRETKFYKSRLVPLGRQLTQSLSQYNLQRQRKGYSLNREAPFFVERDGRAIRQYLFQEAFRRLRKKAGIHRSDGARYQPRLHDLRHTFAVHRLTAWYKQGADVQKWLPVLSVYLGHVHIASTSIYLTMTPALLEEAGRRFQQYAFKEEVHE